MDAVKNEELEPRDEDFEDEEPQEGEAESGPSRLDFDGLFVAPSDWTISAIQNLIGNQIDLDPEFQRRGVWNSKAKSSFIESLFLNVPIPQILLAAKRSDKNAFIVLDGKQRLLTIKQFIDGRFEDGRRFKLTGLRILTDLEGKTWETLKNDPHWSGTFLNQTQRTAVLRGWNNNDVLYEIFHRLNSGSVKLSPMELRMALFPGDFLKFIINWTERIGALHKILRLTHPDKRMADVELAVRFLAFNDQESVYEGNLKKFLDTVCERYNRKFSDESFKNSITARLSNLEEAIESAIKIFGPKIVCRKWKDGAYETRFNRAVFDVVIGSLANSRVRTWALQNTTDFEGLFATLCREDNNFVNALETTTKSVGAVRKRFSAWYDTVSNNTNITLDIPNVRDEASN